jgi:ATP-dependent Clp protease adaptor protein ClpS|tara:strand:+ start:339 stop:653 length:315 start_codon:yes stop_codon:yes gene_type:complete
MTTDTDNATIVKPAGKVELKEPNLWKVIMLNDDVTTMEFVVKVLNDFFDFNEEQANKIVVDIHENGSAVVATLPYEMAEQKGIEVTLAARNDGYPLEVRIEEDK